MDKNSLPNEDVFGELQWVFQRKKNNIKDLQQIRDSDQLYEYIRPHYKDVWDLHERCYVIFFSRSLRILGRWIHTEGSSEGTIVSPKDIIARALTLKSSSFAVIHNHPSGGLEPSKEDLKMKDNLLAAAELMNMAVIDLQIINENGYKSFI